ncbi:MAG: hypothetical protein QOE92_2609 [Chloroflexota bacterium]|jgi:hypothetical protein|nr:hypothetical protein [Chloroflexota bacterium]
MREGLLLLLSLILALSLVQVLSQPAPREWLIRPGREWLRARQARRWAGGNGPRRLTRRYWTEADYLAERERLEPLGYAEVEHRDFAGERARILRAQEGLGGALRGRPPVEPRLPFCIIVWERGGGGSEPKAL